MVTSPTPFPQKRYVHPEFVNVTLFGQRVFEDAIKHLDEIILD